MIPKGEVMEDRQLEIQKTFINLTYGHLEKRLAMLKIISKSHTYGKRTPRVKQKNIKQLKTVRIVINHIYGE
jgi:hypothetical protein